MALARLKLRENTTHGLHNETDQGMSRVPWSLLLCPPKYIDGGMPEPIGETQVHGHKPIQISPMLGICCQHVLMLARATTCHDARSFPSHTR